MKTYEIKNQNIEIVDNLQGEILDIGGEGVIGRAYGAQVTAIDKRVD